ncbi:hypothetical protein ACLESO_04135 [Pyxidicoccus sp. 3LG]
MRVLFPMSAFALGAVLLGAGCASSGPSRSQEVLLRRPPAVFVKERTASLTPRPEGCAVEFVKKDLKDARRTRRVARLEVSGLGLDRPRVEKLLNEHACRIGAERLFIESEEYGRPDQRDEVQAIAYAFSTPVQISHAGIVKDLAVKPESCPIAVLRTKQPEARYQEIAGLHLKLEPESQYSGTTSQVRAMEELRAAACHLGADAVLISQESYDLPGLGSVVSGTAIVFDENLRREKPQHPDTHTL